MLLSLDLEDCWCIALANVSEGRVLNLTIACNSAAKLDWLCAVAVSWGVVLVDSEVYGCAAGTDAEGTERLDAFEGSGFDGYRWRLGDT